MEKFQWGCIACVRGRLSVSKPNQEGKKSLYLVTEDGRKWCM